MCIICDDPFYTFHSFYSPVALASFNLNNPHHRLQTIRTYIIIRFIDKSIFHAVCGINMNCDYYKYME